MPYLPHTHTVPVNIHSAVVLLVKQKAFQRNECALVSGDRKGVFATAPREWEVKKARFALGVMLRVNSKCFFMMQLTPSGRRRAMTALWIFACSGLGRQESVISEGFGLALSTSTILVMTLVKEYLSSRVALFPGLSRTPLYSDLSRWRRFQQRNAP